MFAQSSAFLNARIIPIKCCCANGSAARAWRSSLDGAADDEPLVGFGARANGLPGNSPEEITERDAAVDPTTMPSPRPEARPIIAAP